MFAKSQNELNKNRATMNRFLAVIPARYGSSRFEGKPLVDIFGKPMIRHVWERASGSFDHCVVATDDKRIEDAARAFGATVIMTSSAHRSGTERCNEARIKAEELFGISFDTVINIQGDEPFIHTSQLELIKSCFDDNATQIATLVKPFENGEDIFNENSPKVVRAVNGNALYFSRSVIPFLRGTDKNDWQNSHRFFKHIGLYGYRADVLSRICELPAGELERCESLEQLRWLENGYTIRTAVTDCQSHAIDTPADLELVLKEYSHLFENKR